MVLAFSAMGSLRLQDNDAILLPVYDFDFREKRIRIVLRKQEDREHRTVNIFFFPRNTDLSK